MYYYSSHPIADTAAELAHQGQCGATGRTPQDQAAAVLQPGAEATLVQSDLTGKSPLPENGSGCPQSSVHCGRSLAQWGSVGSSGPEIYRTQITMTLTRCSELVE